MFDRLAALEDELASIEVRLAEPGVFADQEAYVALTRRHKELEPIVAASRTYRQARDDLATAREMLVDATGADKDVVRAEVDDAEATMARLDAELKVLLSPKDPNDGRNVIMELRGAEGARRPTSSPRTCSTCTRPTPPARVEARGPEQRAVRHGRAQRGHLPGQG